MKVRSRSWLVPVVVCAPAILYCLALVGKSQLEGTSFSETRAFEPEVSHGPLRQLLSIAIASGAVGLLYLAPVWLGTQVLLGRDRWRRTAPLWSIAASVVVLIALCALLRETVGISRVSFLAGWASWLLLLAMLARRRISASERESVAAPVLIAGLAAGLILFHPELLLQCFVGDGTEAHELARSLRDHFLPYWELENNPGRFGTVVVNSSLVSAYGSLGLQLLLGSGELAVRLPFWVYWLGILWISSRMIRFGRSDAGWTDWIWALSLSLLMLLSAQWFSFYVGYHAHVAELANPGATDALFTLFLLLSFDALQREDAGGWILALVLASLVLYAGPVFFVLSAGAIWFFAVLPRPRALRAILQGAACLAAIAGFYLAWGLAEGSLESWWSMIASEYLEEYVRAATPLERMSSAVSYLGYLGLGAGGLATLGLVWAFRGDAWDRAVASVALGYLAIILLSGEKNLHYLGPLLPLPMILWARRARQQSETTARALAAATVVSLLVCQFVSWPRSRPVFTANRQLGALTTFQTNSYEEATQYARVVYPAHRRGVLGWFVGAHTWVAYSELDGEAAQPRPFLVTTGDPPSPAYRALIARNEVTLYASDPRWVAWLKRPRSGTRSERFPWVFQPLAH